MPLGSYGSHCGLRGWKSGFYVRPCRLGGQELLSLARPVLGMAPLGHVTLPKAPLVCETLPEY